MNKDKSCRERLPDQLERQLQEFDEMFNDFDSDGGTDESYERIADTPLCVDVSRVVKITLSWGGPADYLHVTLDDNGDIIEIRYQFQDWYDSHTVTLSGDDYDRAERFVSYFTECL